MVKFFDFGQELREKVDVQIELWRSLKICAKVHNNLTKDEKVMAKRFDFGRELTD